QRANSSSCSRGARLRNLRRNRPPGIDLHPALLAGPVCIALIVDDYRDFQAHTLRGRHCMFKTGKQTDLVAGVFCEGFGAAGAVQALNDYGFDDEDIDLIGVLSGRAPDLRWFLLDLGVSERHARYYNAHLEEGAILVMVRTPVSRMRDDALKLLRRHGGTF